MKAKKENKMKVCPSILISKTLICLCMLALFVCTSCNKDDELTGDATLMYGGRTISVSIGKIGKDDKGNTSIQLYGVGDNTLVVNNGKLTPAISMDIVVDKKTLKADSWNISGGYNEYTFLTKKNPEKIIVYVVNGNSSVTFDGKGKKVIQ